MLSRTAAVILTGFLYVNAVAQEDYVPAGPLFELELAKSWQLQLALGADQCLVDAFLVDDQLYFPTNDGYVFAVEAATGANRWLRQITTEAYRIRRPAQAGERVIFATPSTVTQVNKITGEGLAQMTPRFPCGTGVVSDGSRMFLGGLDHRLYAFDVTDPVQSWRVLTNGPISSTPAIYGRDVLFASDDGTIYSAAAYNKVLHWVARTYGPIDSDLAVNDFGVYVPCVDQSLYLFDLRFGELQWRVRFTAPLREPPVLAGGTAYQYSLNDGLVAIDAVGIGVDERIKWKLPTGRMLLTTDNTRAYVLSLQDSILVADLNTGEVTHTIPTPGLNLGVPGPGVSTIYMASPDGRVFCARPRGAPLVRSEKVREALRAPAPAPAAEATAAAPATPPPGAPVGTPVPEPPMGGRSKVSKGYKP